MPLQKFQLPAIPSRPIPSVLTLRLTTDDPVGKKVSAIFVEASRPLIVWSGSTYEAIGDWTQAQLVDAITAAIEADPGAILSAIAGPSFPVGNCQGCQ
jgi:hypothetical protein